MSNVLKVGQCALFLVSDGPCTVSKASVNMGSGSGSGKGSVSPLSRAHRNFAKLKLKGSVLAHNQSI